MQSFNILVFILDLIITITVYSLPIIIARYAVMKHPIERKKAIIICIVYAVLGFVVMAALTSWATDGESAASGGGLILWSYINYRMLTTGKDNRKSAISPTQSGPALAHEGEGNCTVVGSKLAESPSKATREKSIYTRDFLHALKITLIIIGIIAATLGFLWVMMSSAFLIDVLSAIFLNLISVIIFVIGMFASKERSGRLKWWIVGAVLYAITAFGNFMSEYRSYVQIVVGAIIHSLFFYLMVVRPFKPKQE